jgi:hypothetical protein
MLRDCPIDHRCMTAITPEEVFLRAVEMLAHGQGQCETHAGGNAAGVTSAASETSAASDEAHSELGAEVA